MEKDNNKIENLNEEVIEETEKKENNVQNVKVEDINLKEKEEELKDNKNFEEVVKKKTKKTTKIILIIVLILIFMLVISTMFAILNINNENIIKGVYIEDINLSNLSANDVTNVVNEKISKIETVELFYEEYNTIVKLEELGISIDAKDSINKAINIGKTNNILIDNYEIFKAKFFKTKFNLNIEINQEKFKEAINNIQVEITNAVIKYTYEIKDKELIITNGKEGKAIKLEELKEKVLTNIINQFNGNVNKLELPIENARPLAINIDKIYKEIYTEAKDAYIVEEPFELHKEENGVDFNISLEEAKEIIKENKEMYTIPLKITKPEIAVKDLGDKLFKQNLAKYTTIYDAGNYNRSHNIALAAKTINGIVLLPGETFSYNGTLGNTTKEKGYKQAGAYAGGKVVQAYGGGICQVSSTLYNAVLYANLEIVQRYNHTYAVSYVPAGRDATVSYGGKDFKFKNTRKYPIKIVASAKNGVVSISIMGIIDKEEEGYEVELTSSVLSTTPCQTTYEKINSLEEGKEKVIQKGYVGKTSIAYKILKYNGKTVSKTVLSKDTYKPMNRIVQIGAKKVVQTVKPEISKEENKVEEQI